MAVDELALNHFPHLLPLWCKLPSNSCQLCASKKKREQIASSQCQTIPGGLAFHCQKTSSQRWLHFDKFWWLYPWNGLALIPGTLSLHFHLTLLRTTLIPNHFAGFLDVSLFNELWDLRICLMPWTMLIWSSFYVRLSRETGLRTSTYKAEPTTILASLHLRTYPFNHCLSSHFIDLFSVSAVKWLRYAPYR